MEIVRLPIGEPAPVDVDCLRIEQQSAANFRLTASALCVGPDEGVSVSLVGSQLFATAALAEAAGVVWADHVGVERLFVTTGTLDKPLNLLEIDKKP